MKDPSVSAVHLASHIIVILPDPTETYSIMYSVKFGIGIWDSCPRFPHLPLELAVAVQPEAAQL
jgi:hypothetical protein